MARLGLDPKGYYAVLGLTPKADIEAVKRAYRTRAKILHPDRNPSPRASEEFHALSEAYCVLRDPVARRDYDSRLGAHHHPGIPGATHSPDAGPLGLWTCQVCGRTTLDLRYRVLHRVRGRGLRVLRTPITGVFCGLHGDRTAVAASLYCWALGWWALPWGPVATAVALWRNLPGGDFPAAENYQLLASQARAFLARGNLPIARRLTEQARRFARAPAERAHVAQLLDTLIGQPLPPRPDRPPRFGAGQMAQLAPLLLIAAVALYIAGPARLVAPLLTTTPPQGTLLPRDQGGGPGTQGPVSGRTQPSPPPPATPVQGPFTGQTRPAPIPAPAPAPPPRTGTSSSGAGPVGGAAAARGSVTPGALHTVRAASVIVLAAPGRDAREVATLPQATIVMVTGVSADGAWSRVLTARGVSGFVASDALAVVAD